MAAQDPLELKENEEHQDEVEQREMLARLAKLDETAVTVNQEPMAEEEPRETVVEMELRESVVQTVSEELLDLVVHLVFPELREPLF